MGELLQGPLELILFNPFIYRGGNLGPVCFYASYLSHPRAAAGLG